MKRRCPWQVKREASPLHYSLMVLNSTRLKVAAINFLNPAPLMWDFEHAPLMEVFAEKYELRYTPPSQCADDLLAGRADLGLIPIAALTPALAVVPGCTIAALRQVRSILLVSKVPLGEIGTIAGDISSRSSVAYTEVLCRRFLGIFPKVYAHVPELESMLARHDAALLIGDPALLALERRAEVERRVGQKLEWHDVAELWRFWTGLPWVAAVWAVREEALKGCGLRAGELVEDLQRSRDHGLENIAGLVEEWVPRLAVPAAMIRTYLTQNIHYVLDDECLKTVEVFRAYADELGVLPALPRIRMLEI